MDNVQKNTSVTKEGIQHMLTYEAIKLNAKLQTQYDIATDLVRKQAFAEYSKDTAALKALNDQIADIDKLVNITLDKIENHNITLRMLDQSMK